MALYLEMRLFNHQSAQDSTRANAFRHMAWNAFMVASIYQSSLIPDDDDRYEQAQIFSTEVFEYQSRRSTDLHTRRASAMDRHNNRLGWGYMRRRTPDRINKKIPDFGICKRIRRLVGSAQRATYKPTTDLFSRPYNRFRPVYYKRLDLAGYRVTLKPQTPSFDPCGPLKPGRRSR